MEEKRKQERFLRKVFQKLRSHVFALCLSPKHEKNPAKINVCIFSFGKKTILLTFTLTCYIFDTSRNL